MLNAPLDELPPISLEHVLEGRVVSDAGNSQAGELVSFRLLKLAGQGGMGVVYQAQQLYPRRIVALKIMRSADVTPRGVARFQREIDILARLQHPSIARLLQVGQLQPQHGITAPFITMEYVDGMPVADYAAAHRLPLDAKLDLMCRICKAVAHAHGHGIIHRDLKPSNILVTPAGEPRILDFGLASVAASEPSGSAITEAGQVLGTLEYMSPEQALGHNDAVDRRSDVYALGVILYELLAGRRPLDFSGCTVVEAVQRLQRTDAGPLSSVDRRFERDLEVIVGKALAKDRQQRYDSADALAEDLRRFLANEPILARRPTAGYRVRKFSPPFPPPGGSAVRCCSPVRATT